MEIKIVLGATTSAPIYSNHNRSKNWCASINLDPRAPGGLNRNFHKLGKGQEFFYLTSEIHQGDVLEFGADYYSGSGKKNANRKYFYVNSINAEVLDLLEFDTSSEAIEYQQSKLTTEVSEKDIILQKIETLKAELKLLEDQLSSLN